MEYEVWAGRSDSGVASYTLIPADNESRKVLSLGRDSMHDLVTTISADGWDQAKVIYEEMYEQIALAWKARNP